MLYAILCYNSEAALGALSKAEEAAMMGRLAGHSMFAGGEALRRLQMCADCRVVDLASSTDEPSIFDYTGRK